MQSTIKKVPMTRIQSHGSLAISLVNRDVDRCVSHSSLRCIEALGAPGLS